MIGLRQPLLGLEYGSGDGEEGAKRTELGKQTVPDTRNLGMLVPLRRRRWREREKEPGPDRLIPAGRDPALPKWERSRSRGRLPPARPGKRERARARASPPQPPPGTMNPNCARCGKIVYPTEKVNCLDKFWHKACFHCETCKMTLNMKNYKGYEKKPYCNAHYPKQSFTMVADTPENLRLKQQSELQSQVRYKEEFEKSKGKGFSVVADTPELQRIKKTQDQISNIKYHEEFEKSRMGPSGAEGMEPERRDTQDSSSYRRPQEQQQSHHIPTSTPAYQQPQQQQVTPSYGGYKEPAAPVSIQRSAPGGGGKRYRAVYDYSAADEDEVSFQDGDTIVNVQQIDDGWMYGTVERTGDTGMLPANYVEAI